MSVCLSVCLTAVKEKQCIPGYRMFPKLAIGVPGKPGTSTRLWELGPWHFPGKNTGVGCHFPMLGNLPNPGIELQSPASPALAGGFFTTEPPKP